MDAREFLKRQDVSQLTKLIVEDNKVSLTYFLLTCMQFIVIPYHNHYHCCLP